MTRPAHFDDINACGFLFLESIREPEANTIELIVEEAVALEDTVDATSPIRGARPIETIPGCARFTLLFDSYVAYAVINESFGRYDDPTDYDGRLFRIYRTSAFLTFVSDATTASDDYPGPLQHFALICGDHIVNIAACAEPKITASAIEDTSG